jgi:Ser/Thr protein kinase RdoA (MazF antagonist)
MMSDQLLNQALSLYSLDNPSAQLIRRNEIITYMVSDGAEKYVLRIHKPADGFSLGIFDCRNQFNRIKNELEIINRLKAGTGLLLQSPVRTACGDPVGRLQGDIPVSLLSWIDGETLEKTEGSK